MSGDREFACFGAGCFWGVEATFRNVEGVCEALSGYMGGEVENPTYEQVCTDQTGHAEVVRVEFDPGVVGYEDLVKVFFACHDPTQLNRQGPDFGRQYRSVIFTSSDSQEETANRIKRILADRNASELLITTVIEPASIFYRAEEDHQRYLEKRGLASCRV